MGRKRQEKRQDGPKEAEGEHPFRTVALMACIASMYCSSGKSASPSVTEQA
jgi:hypothetical protein